MNQQFEFAYSQMMMFLPWRNEEEDLFSNDFVSCIAKYQSNQTLIEEIKKKVFPFQITVEISDDLQRNDIFIPIKLIYGTQISNPQ